MYRIKHFFSKIVKIFVYISVLWKDEDWDYTYLLELLAAKLIFMKRYFMHSSILTEESNKEIINGINKTLENIDNFLNFDVKGDTSSIKPPFETVHEARYVDNGNCEFVTLNKETGKELTENEQKEYSRYLVKLENKEHEYWEAIFDTIKNEGRKWWD